MKILQVCPIYYPYIGGVGDHVKNLSERLAKDNAVTVFTGDFQGGLPREEEINGVSVRRFRSFAPSSAYHMSFEMIGELKKGQFDIVHGHDYHAFPLYFSRYARRDKFVVTPHYHRHGRTPVRDFLIQFYKPFGKKIFEDADRIIAVSDFEKELLLQDFGMDEDKISLIPNGINLAEFAGLERIPKKTRTILCVSRLERYKGIQEIIQALPLLDSDFRLRIVGRGPYQPELTALTNKLGLSQRVEFYQGIPRDELLEMYAEAGIFILLSQLECFSIVVGEALAANTPCIVARTSALNEWIDNKNCFGIDYPVRVDELAELVGKVAGGGVGGVELWDWDRVTLELARLYGLEKESGG